MSDFRIACLLIGVGFAYASLIAASKGEERWSGFFNILAFGFWFSVPVGMLVEQLP